MDLDASKHLNNHGEWVKDMKKPSKESFVKTCDNTLHPITHTRKFPLCVDGGNVRYLKNVVHVPKVPKKLVFLAI